MWNQYEIVVLIISSAQECGMTTNYNLYEAPTVANMLYKWYPTP